MMVILPFLGSYRWATVSLPLPVSSWYQNVFRSRIPKYWPPLGDTLTCPLPDSGAVETQNNFCSWIHGIRDYESLVLIFLYRYGKAVKRTSGISSKNLPIVTESESMLEADTERGGCNHLAFYLLRRKQY
jgi:hypothetical protein